MDNINYLRIIATVGAIIPLIVAYFNKEKIKNTKLKDEYFEKLLVPYISECKKDNDLSAVTFIKMRYSYNNFFIPTYIFKLVDNNETELLKKVLIVDYWDTYPNKENNIHNTLNNLSEIVDFLIVYIFRLMMLLLTFSLFFVIVLLFAGIFSYLIGGGIESNVGSYIVYLIIGVPLLIYIKFSLKRIINSSADCYTMKNSKIEDLLKKIEKKYNKNFNKYYIN